MNIDWEGLIVGFESRSRQITHFFDRETGDLFIADVGQNVVEEVDFAAAPRPHGSLPVTCRYTGQLCNHVRAPTGGLLHQPHSADLADDRHYRRTRSDERRSQDQKPLVE